MPPDWIKRHDHFDELGSTSTHLAQIWRNGEISESDTPIVVSTNRQTAGRGRGDNRWFSDQKSLTFTLGIRPESFDLALSDVLPVGLLAACCMIESMLALWPSLEKKVGIRWPNDIECDEGKIGGVLPECIIQNDRGMLLLIGIGINVGTDLSQSPADARLIGCAIGSLIDDSDKSGCLPMSLLDIFLHRFPHHLQKLITPESNWILDALKYDRLNGHRIEARQGLQAISGIALGWDEAGHLLVRTDTEALEKISSGQILRQMPPTY